ncbi:hypothetical protein F5146DRAFT_1167000 [Armillaria mellea]|nr:hypothetical protein F5146DRAFT_1167000 [Armillaria mellea]
MPALNASLQVASLVEASGVPYVEKLAKVAVAVIELLEDLEDVQGKHRGFKGFLNVNKFQDTIQGYKKRVDDLKMDFLIHLTGNSMLTLAEIHSMVAGMELTKETASREGSVIIQITITRVAFFFQPEDSDTRFTSATNYPQLSGIKSCQDNFKLS